MEHGLNREIYFSVSADTGTRGNGDKGKALGCTKYTLGLIIIEFRCGIGKLSPPLLVSHSPCLINRGRKLPGVAQGSGQRAWSMDLTGIFSSSNQQTRGQGEMGTRRTKALSMGVTH